MLTPGEHPQLIVTHMDDSETLIELTDLDAYSWQPTVHGLTIRRVTGRATFPWQTIKSYTIIPAAGTYHPSDLPNHNCLHGLFDAEEIARLRAAANRSVFEDD